MSKEKRAEIIFWSIAFPGFGQFLNQKYAKGFLFVLLEFIVNVQARLNLAIIPSFYGLGESANATVNYQWIMFYPCLYLFSMYDAYRDAGGKEVKYAFIPFVTSAYAGTIGVIYSSIEFFGQVAGVIWLPIIFHLSGYVIGMGIRLLVLKTAGVEPQP
ncbi:hypothetical protein JCM9140_743 [Halalkalibacter wakoensis JCM 9140]|uniref:Uncharacterized protein n=1 Tax=Halalkalibacter wakoensis JCM 9140 TaxID=1236970 RepID=W4PY71_9BACI|nr:hypothetical protein [Halalkalibacter wakoensis]GAE24791.1 hypothetical protein JCM9140_743 [Halalkalibacter wakoensis JCM 9140]